MPKTRPQPTNPQRSSPFCNVLPLSIFVIPETRNKGVNAVVITGILTTKAAFKHHNPRIKLKQCSYSECNFFFWCNSPTVLGRISVEVSRSHTHTRMHAHSVGSYKQVIGLSQRLIPTKYKKPKEERPLPHLDSNPRS